MRWAIIAAALAGMLLASASLVQFPMDAEYRPMVQIAAPSRLGDISWFRAIVVDTQALLDHDDLAGAKMKIKLLETSWDEAEGGIKRRSPNDWHKVDRAIDRALAAIVADMPDRTACRQALVDLLNTMSARAG